MTLLFAVGWKFEYVFLFHLNTALNIFNWCSELRETVEKQSEVIINIKVSQAQVSLKLHTSRQKWDLELWLW